MASEKPVDTSNERIAVVCMLVTNPDNKHRPDDWRKQVNDLIRALRDERNTLKAHDEDQRLDRDDRD